MKMVFPSLKRLDKLASQEYSRKNYSLDIMYQALLQLGNPENRLKNVIHITGTNGKGATASYTASLLHEQGYKVGLYTSPHMMKVNERIMIGMKPVKDSVLDKALGKVFSVNVEQPLTFFEAITCAMFLIFSESDLDVCVIEVGLGGTLDATNVIKHPLLSVITSVSLDHVEVLGRTVVRIAKDKSGIIKKHSACLCGENSTSVMKIIKKKCKREDSLFIPFPEKMTKITKFDFKSWKTRFSYQGKLSGEYELPVVSLIQHKNAGLALRVVEYFLIKKSLKMPTKKEIQKAWLFTVPGRMEKLKVGTYQIIYDGAHNPAAIRNFVETLLCTGDKSVVLAIAMMQDKDIGTVFKEIVRLKNVLKKIYFYSLDTERSMSQEQLIKMAEDHLHGVVMEKASSISHLLKKLQDHDRAYFCGTLYAYKSIMEKVQKIVIP